MVSHSVATMPGNASEQSAVTASRAPSTISAQRASRSPVVLTQIGDSAATRPATSVPQSWRRVHGRIQGHLLLMSVGRPAGRPVPVSRVAPAGGGGIAASPHLRVPGSRKAGRRLATMPVAAPRATLRPASLLEKGR
jgi:hypothetical protein